MTRATASTTSPASCASRSSLLEQYLTAARRVSSVAVGTDAEVVRLTYRVPPDDSQQDEVDGLGIGTRGGLRFRHNFPQDAEYELAVGLLRNFHGYITGMEFAHRVEIAIDGEQVFTAQVGGPADLLANDRNMSAAADDIHERLKARVRVAAGPHDVGVTFYRRNRAQSDEPLQLHERHHDLQDMNGLPIVDHVTLSGPFNSDRPGQHAEPPADLHLPPGSTRSPRVRQPRRKPHARGRSSRAWPGSRTGGR